MRTILLIAAAATLSLALASGCRRSGYEGSALAETASKSAARPAAQAKPAVPPKAQQEPNASTAPSAGAKADGARVEQLHTPDGIVTITRTPKATPADLGIPAFPGADAKESSAWRLKPPKGRDWLLAIGSFTTGASIESLEQFYRKALEGPEGAGGSGKSAPAPKVEVRRGGAKGETVVVLSRIKDVGGAATTGRQPRPPRESESIVVRLTRAAGAKTTAILIRRSIKGAAVKIEPSGELPGPSGPQHGTPPAPRPRRAPNPKGIPVSGHSQL